jgi:hypothetical protein
MQLEHWGLTFTGTFLSLATQNNFGTRDIDLNLEAKIFFWVYLENEQRSTSRIFIHIL